MVISRRKICIAVFIALAALITCSGCNTMPGAVSDTIARRLPSMLGSADHYDVQVGGNIVDLLRGKIDSVNIHGVNVALSPELRVSDIKAVATNIHVDMRGETVRKIGATTFNIALTQDNLNNYLALARMSEYENGARVGLNPDDFTYSNKVHILGFATPYTVTGTLVPHPGSIDQLDFVPSKASVARFGIPLKLVQIAVDRQNPVVDLSSMKYPVAIRSTVVSKGIIHVQGTVDLVAIMNAARSVASAEKNGH